MVKLNRGRLFHENQEKVRGMLWSNNKSDTGSYGQAYVWHNLTYSVNIGLLNLSNNLNEATRILEGDVGREANLRCIVNWLPNDLIFMWRNKN